MINQIRIELKIVIAFCICSLFVFTTIEAQKYRGQRFKIGAVVALNAAQIDGDRIFGYNKLGVQAGIQGITMLTKKQYLSLEFLISQRGAITSADEVGSHRVAYTNISSNYIEVPLLYNIKLPFGGDNDGMYLYSGFSVARLLGIKIEGIQHPKTGNSILELKDRTAEFDTFEVDYIIGGSYFFNKNWGITFRHTIGITTFFKPNEVDITAELQPLRNYFFTIGGVYILN